MYFPHPSEKIVVFFWIRICLSDNDMSMNRIAKKMSMFHHIIHHTRNRCACYTVLAAFLAASCASSLLEKGGWEGIRGKTLRVYIALDIPEDISQGAVAGRMKELLLAGGKKRAMILLTAYIREKISDPDRANSCRSAIDGIVNSGKMIYHECGEYSCAAFIDFTMNGCNDTGQAASTDGNE